MDTHSEDVAEMLRDAVRRLLLASWPAESAVRLSESPAAIETAWARLVEAGVASLGHDASLGGFREILVVMEELGRAHCPAPMLHTVLMNLILPGVAGDFAQDLARRLQSGEARAAFSFGSQDPDAGAADLTISGGVATGRLRFVEAADVCTHFAVLQADHTLSIVARTSVGVTIVPTRAMGAAGLHDIEFAKTPVVLTATLDIPVGDLLRLARLALAARAYGAAKRSFDLAVDYSKERRQFGSLIGKFQAIQHKLANCHIALEGVRLTLAAAALQKDRADPAWRYFADAATAFAGASLRQVALETQHTFGAIGYAEEHEAPRHFKRVHLDVTALGGARAAREGVASHLLDHGGAPLPDYDLGAAGNKFRDEVRDWLAQNWSGARKAAFDAQPFAKREFNAEFARDMGKTGWIGLGWPAEFGGQARSPLEQIAFMETMERGEAPRIGAAIQANALMMFGSAEQKAKYLPEILRGEAMHGMGYSEPQAGSDLAAMRTLAVRDGESWVINGQKIWTTTWWGKYMFLAARTDPAASPPHAGISMFIVPMDSKGVTIRPATTMYDGSFANIFYDDVRIPAENIVGEVNGGWKVLTGALAFERGLVGGGIVLKVAHAFERLRRRLLDGATGGRASAADPLTRDKLATLASEIEVGRQLMMYCAERAEDGITPPDIGAISKVFSGELMERFGESVLDILGTSATLSEQQLGAIDNGRFEQNLRHSLMWVISIGTNEIQRSLIAQRGLGLPR